MDIKIDLSIILINYNAAKLTIQAIESILNTVCRTSVEIIVVENGDDESEILTEEIAYTRVLRAIENRGFSHACNVGARVAQGKYILFLNNDTIVHSHVIDDSVAYINHHPEIGVMGVQMLLQNGELDHGCKRGFPTPMASFCYFMKLDRIFPKNKIIGAYRQGFVSKDSVANVDAVSGAFMMLSTKLFWQIGGFDEAYFMYGEDVDLCYRIKQMGFRNVYYGLRSITHLKGQSGLHLRNQKVLDAFYDSMKIFYDKHYEQKYGKILSFIVKLSIQIKYQIAMKVLQKGESNH